jgi:hypothetical protein
MSFVELPLAAQLACLSLALVGWRWLDKVLFKLIRHLFAGKE